MIKKIKQVVFFGILLSTSWMGHAQVVIDIRYFPEAKYTVESKQTSTITVDIKGNEEFKRNFEKSGTKLPLMMNNDVFLSSIIETGKQEGDKIGFNTTFTAFDQKFAINGQPETVPNFLGEAVISGTYTDGNKIDITSIKGDKLDVDTKQLVTQMIREVSKNFSFPTRPIAMGENFKLEMNASFPAGPMGNIELVMEYNFILQTKKGHLSYFDFVVNVKSVVYKDKSIKVRGNGTGKMVYNSQIKLLEDLQNEMDIEISGVSEEFLLTAKMKSTSRIQTKKLK
ncbi:MAG: hypothetical protein LBE34_10265 [Flavobacteriaceae bacterium]|jgi:hypothetical protein|nr:hypothetical protein [Flavobacteriaceae bacterium]